MNLRYQKILNHSCFTEAVTKIELVEKDRIFCRHGMEHLISVARIAYINALEEQSDISKDIIYAAALLHDIGRADEYETGISHNKAGAEKASRILLDCGYSEAETEQITEAVKTHGHDGYPEKASELERILCTADKLSRTCFCCSASPECNWSEEKKNNTLIY